MRLSILTPAFNEAENLPALYERLVRTMAAVGVEWEWVVVDDHSRDSTFEVIEELASRDPRVRGVRLARNSGSHVAITCALHQAEGDAAVMMAADLQDPPETLTAMLDRWRDGAQVVWAVRQKHSSREVGAFPTVYYWIMRHLVGMKEMPATGADFFLIDRAVIEAFRRCSERNVSVLALITWLGFRQDYIDYKKQPRVRGRSGWTLARKVKLVIDSVTSFSEFPIRFCSYGGALFATAGVIVSLIGAFLFARSGFGVLLIGVMLGLTGIQLIGLGMVGEYVWRALEEARGRPIYLIEAVAGRATAWRTPAIE